MRSSITSDIVEGVHTRTSSLEVNSAESVEVLDVTVGEILELREVQDWSSLPVQDLDAVRSGTITIEVGLSLDVGNVDLVNKVLELGEVKNWSLLTIEGLDVVRSGTISFEICLGLDVGDIDLIDQVLEARDWKDHVLEARDWKDHVLELSWPSWVGGTSHAAHVQVKVETSAWSTCSGWSSELGVTHADWSTDVEGSSVLWSRGELHLWVVVLVGAGWSSCHLCIV